MKILTRTTYTLFGIKVGNIEVEREIVSRGAERGGSADNPMPVNPDIFKPIAREAVAFLEPFAKNTVQSDPSFDEAMASEYDSDRACEEMKKDGVTKKGAKDLTYAFLLLGPMSEQRNLAPFFKGAIEIVIDKHWSEEKVTA